MEFVSVKDIKKILKEIDKGLDSMNGDDVYESLMYWLKGVKKYRTERKPYMPIRIRDYGYTDGPHEYDCGADQNHHWLRIWENGYASGCITFTNIQDGQVSECESVAKAGNYACFVPNYESKDGKKYITPETMLMLVEGENDED